MTREGNTVFDIILADKPRPFPFGIDLKLSRQPFWKQQPEQLSSRQVKGLGPALSIFHVLAKNSSQIVSSEGQGLKLKFIDSYLKWATR